MRREIAPPSAITLSDSLFFGGVVVLIGGEPEGAQGSEAPEDGKTVTDLYWGGLDSPDNWIPLYRGRRTVQAAKNDHTRPDSNKTPGPGEAGVLVNRPEPAVGH